MPIEVASGAAAARLHASEVAKWERRLLMEQLQESKIRASRVTAAAENPATFSKTASLLMDLKLQVRVLFGRSQMRFKDVVKLGPGSIVELDRSPDDIVELLVNDRVIARGQVVVVEGCYGVRITEILKRGDSSDNATANDLVSLFQGMGA
jgi:flagellar motor switch protein FliN/FliY